MSKKNDNNNILYWIIAVMALIIVWMVWYTMGQNGWSTTSNSEETPLVTEAGNIGLDKGDLMACIAENKYVEKINGQMKTWQENFGITWTPWNILINNTTGEYVVISWAYPKEAFIENIENLLWNIEVSDDNTEKKDFKVNTDKGTLVIISDKRDSTSPIEQIKWNLQQIEAIKELNIVNYDFSDNWVSAFLESNSITTLPAVIFAKEKVDTQIDQYIEKKSKNIYSLNIGATFNPFENLSENWFKIVNTELLEQIKKDSYIDWNKDAKVTWLEYSDLECPFCAKLHNSDVEATLKAKYWTDLNIIFNHFPLGFHAKAIPWANILECVWEQGWSEAFYKILKYAFKNEIQE